MRGWLATVSAESLRADALAGLLGAILALPQGIAFAKLAGLPPQYGIYSAIVPCAVAALFGSSHHVVSGPTNANSLALFAALSPLAAVGSPHYIALALTVTALVGLSQLVLGALRLAWVTDFIAPSVLLGFISGAAILIGLYAIPDVLGTPPPPGHDTWSLLSSLPGMVLHVDSAAAIVGAITLITTIIVARVFRKLPYMLIGIAAGYLTSEALRVATALPPVPRIGLIPSVLPPLSLPIVPAAELVGLLPIGLALSTVALGQSVSIAKALAERSGQRIDVDREFVGQGLSNVVGSFFSCYVSCGSLNRSLPNYLAGARSGLAAFFSAAFLLVLAYLTLPLLERLPIAAIGALLIYIAVGLVDVAGFRELARLNRTDLAIAVTTLVCMLCLSFQQAIMIGVGLSLLVYLHRTSHPAVLTLVPDPASPSRTFTPTQELAGPSQECPQLKLVRIEGAIYYGAASTVGRRLDRLRTDGSQKHLLVMARSMNFLDLSGASVWERELKLRRESGGDLYFHRPRARVQDLWAMTEFRRRLGAGNVYHSKRQAISSIYRALDPDVCASCRVRLFRECSGPAGE